MVENTTSVLEANASYDHVYFNEPLKVNKLWLQIVTRVTVYTNVPLYSRVMAFFN